MSAFAMNDNHDDTRSALPTPQSTMADHSENNYEHDTDAKHRGIFAIWSVLQNADIDANSRLDPSKFTIGGKHIKALVSLSGSLLSMLVQFGDDMLYEQSMSDLAKFVHTVMDQCDGRKQAEELARFLSGHIQGPDSAASSPATENDTPLITPEEDMQDAIELDQEENSEHATINLEPLPDQPVPLHEYNQPPIGYDPTPIAKLGAQLLHVAFGSDACPETVVDYSPTLAEYITDAISTARIDRSIAVYALALVERLSARSLVSMPHGTFGLFITAYTIASKVLSDYSFNNQSWDIIGQRVFTVKELNSMERMMYANLEWNLIISVQEIEEIEKKIHLLEHYGVQDGYGSSSVSTHVNWVPSLQNHSLPSLTANAVSTSFWDNDPNFTLVFPETTASQNSSVPIGFNDSPGGPPPIPHPFPSALYHQAMNINHTVNPVWGAYSAAFYEADEVYGENGHYEDGQGF